MAIHPLVRLADATKHLIATLRGMRRTGNVLLDKLVDERGRHATALPDAYQEYCDAYFFQLAGRIADLYSVDSDHFRAVGVSGLTAHEALKQAALRDLKIIERFGGNENALETLPDFPPEEWDGLANRCEREWVNVSRTFQLPSGSSSTEAQKLAESAASSDKATGKPHAQSTVPIFLGNGRYQLPSDGGLITLAGNQANVLEALVRLKTATLVDLQKRSGVTNPSQVLAAVCKAFPSLAPFIRLPGGKSKGGYSTTIVQSPEDMQSK